MRFHFEVSVVCRQMHCARAAARPTQLQERSSQMSYQSSLSSHLSYDNEMDSHILWDG